MLSTVLEGDPDLSTGGYLDLRTGQVYDDTATDPMIVGRTPPSTLRRIRTVGFGSTAPVRGTAGGIWRRLLKDVAEGREAGDATTLSDNTVMATLIRLAGARRGTPGQLPV
jgi:hypothetical protein